MHALVPKRTPWHKSRQLAFIPSFGLRYFAAGSPVSEHGDTAHDFNRDFTTQDWHPGMGNNSEELSPTPDERVTFGKFRGWLFKEVVAKDPSYCQWVTRKAEQEAQETEQGSQAGPIGFQRFATFLAKHSAQIESAARHPPTLQPWEAGQGNVANEVTLAKRFCSIGQKHRGKTFEEVYEHDRGYSDWAVQKALCSTLPCDNNLLEYAVYVMYRDTTKKVEPGGPDLLHAQGSKLGQLHVGCLAINTDGGRD